MMGSLRATPAADQTQAKLSGRLWVKLTVLHLAATRAPRGDFDNQNPSLPFQRPHRE